MTLASHHFKYLHSYTPKLAVKPSLKITPLVFIFVTFFFYRLPKTSVCLMLSHFLGYFPPTTFLSHLLPSCCSADCEVPHHCCKDILGWYSNLCTASDWNPSLMHNEWQEINDEKVTDTWAPSVSRKFYVWFLPPCLSTVFHVKKHLFHGCYCCHWKHY